MTAMHCHPERTREGSRDGSKRSFTPEILRGVPLRMTLLLMIVSSFGCDTTPVSDSWRDPAFSSPIRFQRTLVIAMTSDVLLRRSAEDEMVRQFGEGRSIQAYKLISDSDRYDVNHLVQKLTPNG